MAKLSALTTHVHPWAALTERTDLELHDGVFHLRADQTTPHDASIEDLLMVADVIERSGAQVLLLRLDSGMPAIAVDAAERDRVMAALVGECTRQPVYAKIKGSAAALVSDVRLPAQGPSSVRVFRPRVVGPTLRYGVAQAVRIEFWVFGEELVEAPHANALTRRLIPRDDIETTTVERHGRSWRTLRGMFDAHPHEFTGDIDMVFSWVDGSSTDFQRQRAAHLEGYVVGEGDDGPARYRHVDELRYALRSVHMYAPWVRRIFIATDSPAPAWLVDHPKVTIVRSEEFFADTSVLPTHNSHAVESQLHRIDGLAEHFLYSNDDMFFARPVTPDLFFTPAGVTKFVECDVRIGPGPSRRERSGHDNALRVNRELLHNRFGRTITRDLEHCAAPLRRSVLAELESEFAEDFARTAGSRFRSATDISVTNSLYHYYALFAGLAGATQRPRGR